MNLQEGRGEALLLVVGVPSCWQAQPEEAVEARWVAGAACLAGVEGAITEDSAILQGVLQVFQERS